MVRFRASIFRVEEYVEPEFKIMFSFALCPSGCVGTETLWGSGKPELKGVKMALIGVDLWRKFHNVHTEMIITKLGR
jgi:hypothetical protein